eukprot:3120502-Amphidinium_carterae.1
MMALVALVLQNVLLAVLTRYARSWMEVSSPATAEGKGCKGQSISPDLQCISGKPQNKDSYRCLENNLRGVGAVLQCYWPEAMLFEKRSFAKWSTPARAGMLRAH